jgi:hypothetical protein
MVIGLDVLFPGLRGSGYQITSAADRKYNCVAWAAGDVQQWWWPDPGGVGFWPPAALRLETVAALQQLFELLGYSAGSDEGLEAQVEKVAIFSTAQGSPTHMARQLANGRWTSKLGEREDIEHALRDLEGAEYGVVVLIMKRLQSTSSTSP